MVPILMANVPFRPQNSTGNYFWGFLTFFHLIFTFKYFLESKETKSKSEKLIMTLLKKEKDKLGEKDTERKNLYSL